MYVFVFDWRKANIGSGNDVSDVMPSGNIRWPEPMETKFTSFTYAYVHYMGPLFTNVD